MNLTGRIAVVTGGSRGIGKGISISLARAGAAVAVNWVQDNTAAERTVSEITSLGGKAFAYRCDVAYPKQVTSVVEEINRTLGKVDILVNNAGVAVRGCSIVDTNDEEMRRMIDVNLLGAFHFTKAVIPYMRKASRGDIIFISSVVTTLLAPERAAYALSKAGIEAMAMCLAKEEAPNGIRVNVIKPGLVETDMTKRLMRERFGYEVSRLYGKAPLGRIVQPYDIGNLCVFLASEEGSHITGQIITVDGGTPALGLPASFKE